jgi:ribosomal protein RSM22 (predicted rRNA methylase)
VAIGLATPGDVLWDAPVVRGPIELPGELVQASVAALSDCGLSQRELQQDVRRLHDFLFSREVQISPGEVATPTNTHHHLHHPQHHLHQQHSTTTVGYKPSEYKPTIKYGDREAVAYLGGRHPMGYAATTKVFDELASRCPDFLPTKVLDFGSGPFFAAVILVFRFASENSDAFYALWR